MSLQLAAQHMASCGRGPDTTLVHMAPQEVAGLQALAKAHGGSLTINPDTGLPEAGFLSSILPLVAGAFLGPAGLGLTAMQAGLAAGALGTVATGSLKKGLMAGLGAYGGAGLAGSIMGAGTSAGLGAAAGEAALAGDAAAQAAQAQASSAVIDPLSGMEAAGLEERAAAAGMYSPTYGVDSPGYDVGLPSPPPTQAGSMVPVTTPPPAIPAPTSAADQYAQMRAAGFSDADIAQSAREFAENTAGTAASPFSAATQKALSSPLSAGFDAFKADPSKFMTKENLRYGLMGLAPVAADMMTPKTAAPRPVEATPRYTYDPGRVADPQTGYTGAYTGERTYLNPIYTRTAAGGGLMDIGPVEAMSDRNEAQTLMANQGQMFAEGGETKAVRRVEEDPYYTMSGQSGDAFKYLMGQMPATPRAAAPAAAATPAPVQSTVQAAPAQERKGLFGSVMRSINPEAGGYYEDDTSGLIKPYSFDPATGLFTAVAPKKVFRPYEPEPAMDYGSFTGGGYAQGGIASLAQGGPSHLGDYSDGGRLLKGPGDGVSDSIPATIADKRPARLADGEFVVPARIVSELGNGSTEAGARKLYAMMDRVQKARKKSIGKDQVAVNSRAEKLLPA